MPTPRPKLTIDTLYEFFVGLKKEIRGLRTNPQMPFTSSFVGVLTAGTAATAGTDSFGITFQDPPVVIPAIQDDSPGGAASICVTIDNITTTGFDWRLFTSNGANAAATHTLTVAYIVVGL